MLLGRQSELLASCQLAHRARRIGNQTSIRRPLQTCSVAAPQRIPAPPLPSLIITRTPEQEAQLAAMLTQDAICRDPSSEPDLPSDPDAAPTSSGRAHSPANGREQPSAPASASVATDRPYLPGSRRRRGAPARNHRSSSLGSFYGEYCDLQASQAMLSQMWQRIVVASNGPGGAQGVEAQAQAVPEAVSAGAGLSTIASAAGLATAASDQAVDTSSQPLLPIPQQRQRQHQQQLEQQQQGRATAEVHEAIAQAQADPGQSAGTATASPSSPSPSSYSSPASVIPSVSATLPRTGPSPPQPQPRVLLYLGPEFQVALPPPLPDMVVTQAWAGGGVEGGGGLGGGIRDPWELSEQELQQCRAARPPQRVRGSRLSTGTEKWRTVRSSPQQTSDDVEATESGVVAGRSRAGGRNAKRREGSGTVTEGQMDDASVPERGNSDGAVRVRATTAEAGKTTVRAEVKKADGRGRDGARGRGAGAVATTAAAGATATASTVPPSLSPDRQQQQQQQQQRSLCNPVGPAGAAPGSRTQPQGQQKRGASFQARLSREEDVEAQQAGYDPGDYQPKSTPRQLMFKRHLVEALTNRLDDATVTKCMQTLHSVHTSGATALNHVMRILADMGHVHALHRMLTLQVALGLENEHTYSVAFRGWYAAGKMGLALRAFEEACRSGRDLGPIACSVLLHIASQERNLRLGWQLLDHMMECRMTLNRFAFNSMAHLAAAVGAVDDVVLLYNMMKAEAAGMGEGLSHPEISKPRPDCAPDSYTFSALVKAVNASGRADMLPALFNEMVAQHRAAERERGRAIRPGDPESRLSQEVWGAFISTASRGRQYELSLRFFDAGLTELGLQPNPTIYNSVLATLAKFRPLAETFAVYREMVSGTFRPIFPGILRAQEMEASAAARGGSRRPPPLDRSAATAAIDTTATVAAATASNAARGKTASGDGLAEDGRPGLAMDVDRPIIPPDHYTYNALVTAASHHRAPLADLARIRTEMVFRGVQLNTHIGTSLLHAYRRTPELAQSQMLVQARAEAPEEEAEMEVEMEAELEAAADGVRRVVGEAEAVMGKLVQTGTANTWSYIGMATLYAAAAQPLEVVRTVREMMSRGLMPDPPSWRVVIQAVQDAELLDLVEPLERLYERQRLQVRQLKAWQRQQQQQQMAA